jgi:hypothetical protein
MHTQTVTISIPDNLKTASGDAWDALKAMRDSAPSSQMTELNTHMASLINDSECTMDVILNAERDQVTITRLWTDDSWTEWQSKSVDTTFAKDGVEAQGYTVTES